MPRIMLSDEYAAKFGEECPVCRDTALELGAFLPCDGGRPGGSPARRARPPGRMATQLTQYAQLVIPIPQAEERRLIREVLLNRDLNPGDVLDLAVGMDAFLVAQPDFRAQMQRQWDDEHEMAAEAERHGIDVIDG